MNYFRTVSVMPEIPDNIARLKELAYNMWFSWNNDAQRLFSMLDKHLWKETNHNPVKFLLNIFPERLKKAAGDPRYLTLYQQVTADFDAYMKRKNWFHEKYPETGLLVAYFSAELGVHESTPVYSGGLGILAGDHCKSASDLGIPLVGVGILYKQGYFSQKISREGWQETGKLYLSFNEIPVLPALHKDGSPIIIPVAIAGRIVYIKVWQQQIGRVTIYLLDANISENSPEDRELTSQLYGGDQSTRIAQEIILGIGGVKALRQLGISPTVWHINEGHAAFLILERIREMVQNGLSFSTACEAVRSSVIFTTHTPVPAGHDIFSREMINSYLGDLASTLQVDLEKLLSLGWDEKRDGFNMTRLALQHSSYTNGVSRLHCRVSREMFSYMFDRIPLEEIPIDYVTNGVHLETWTAPEIKTLLREHLGPDWADYTSDPQKWKNVYQIPDQNLWEAHQKCKEAMIQFVKNNIYHRMRRNFEPVELIRESMNKLRKDVLVIGFARRFATYKRANLLLRDKERLAQMLNHPTMPAVIIFAGKAHPADYPAQEIIKQLCDLEKDSQFRGRVIFVENYDINAARYLVQGVDVWLNTPRRPLEASGTSGQKAAVNGVLNCSILDGWWPEAYNGKNGYAIGTDKEYPKEYPNEEIQDKENVHSLFEILEQVIIPTYYRQESGIPGEWILRMKECLATIPGYFNTHRMVREYCDKFYLPAAQREKQYAQNSYQLASQLQEFKQMMKKYWHQVYFQSVQVNQPPDLKAGDEIAVEANVFLGLINPQDVIAEIFYGKVHETGLSNITLVPMTWQGITEEQQHKFSGRINLTPGTTKYALRIRPYHPCFNHPFELPLVKWADSF